MLFHDRLRGGQALLTAKHHPRSPYEREVQVGFLAREAEVDGRGEAGQRDDSVSVEALQLETPEVVAVIQLGAKDLEQNHDLLMLLLAKGCEAV